MDLSQIISNSFKYPFKDLKRLAILCMLFVLPVILPIGVYYDSDIVSSLGIIVILVLILIIPGYTVSIVKKGSIESSNLPSLSIGKNIIDTFKLLVLRIVYMIVPIAVFLVLLFAAGSLIFTIGSVSDVFGFLSALGIVFLASYIVYIIFEFLLIFAKARLAHFNSLTEALKIHKVLKDIKSIGVGRVIGWYIVMAILLGVISIICALLIFIPYVGILLYFCVSVPIILVIYYYSLGLLYSNIVDGSGDDLDLDKFEKEIQRLKYGI